MSLTDPVADALTRIRNAQLAFHETVEMPYSRMKEAIVRILSEEGYVGGFQVVEERSPFKKISVTLKYLRDREPAIRRLQRISRPGRRIYVGKDDIPQVLGGMGVSILSTSQGVMTGKAARSEGVGGEVLIEIY